MFNAENASTAVVQFLDAEPGQGQFLVEIELRVSYGKLIV